MTKLRALIVEDDRVTNGMLKRKFESRGYEATTCFDGMAGMQELSNHHFDCVILDLNMPKAGGMQVLEKKRDTQNSATPAYILTSMDQDEERLKAIRLGARRVFQKQESTPAEVVKEIVEECAA